MADPQDRPDSEPGGASQPPAKRQPAKKAAKAPAKKAPAKKGPAKKAPAKKAPAKRPEPVPPKLAKPPVGQQIETNGQLGAAAKDAAAQAKSTVDRAKNPLPQNGSRPSPRNFPVPVIIAITLSLLAILLVRQLRRH
ncbi:nucleoid-structuring protein H-NS [Mycobacterium shinjukuense]|uniref:Histone-like protein Hns n=1 Tax=Mycobacterium shinjukuense TaxID=398694 RepID=A0A7I7MTQ1_9MYCO|nr:nucleoid-structuring protein H-NS [Mycobacterium shinjukuense]MCV6986583.1 nucleoid-structuring protein H-NS [Mycobacterium shinjukuense]ORB67283.1 nucleoid-structuring protein H-NS [Mycobacterium shinjukuense]BBX75545.1 histone-like protein Hns [Mycobacterium shinjukuense]